jgi:membrane-bound serine protease (ClpP class)
MRIFPLLLCLLLPLLRAQEADSAATPVPAASAAAVEAAPPPAGVPRPPPEPVASGLAFVIPVQGAIDHTRLYILKRGLAAATEAGANAIVLDMDTLGGALMITDEMTKLIMEAQVPTFTFVEKDAISAGAIIAMSTDHIYMKPGSRIGDAMPVMMSSSGGGYETLGDAEREKITSPTDAMVRLIAERKGRDILLARCMVRRELEYIRDGVVISAKGEILTMTNQEAARTFGEPPKPLLSEGTVGSVEEMLTASGRTDWRVQRLEEAPAETFANLLGKLAPLLIGLASLLFYLEMNTPGFGWAGITAMLLFALFFFGQHAAGLAGNEEILVFILGVVLIALEIFLIPGFGLAGITGLVLVVGSLFASMVKFFPDALPSVPEGEWGFFDRIYGLQHAVRSLSLGIIGAGVGGFVAARYLPRSRMGHRLVLQENISGRSDAPDAPGVELVGARGLALTALRPAGRVEVAGRVLDVVSNGGFIDKGSAVVVVQCRGAHIVVERAPAAPEASA